MHKLSLYLIQILYIHLFVIHVFQHECEVCIVDLNLLTYIHECMCDAEIIQGKQEGEAGIIKRIERGKG